MNTIIFLGPSLPLTEAKKILPNAWYHDPVQCGDIIRVLRLRPTRLLIIDGYYETTAAVWHKEILLALDQGIPVYGASSMGGLRAAELAHFGMQGIGEIFNLFYHKKLTDDDEVAVLHGPADNGFRPLNEAMVNIRYTLQRAIKEKIISTQLAERVIHQAKQSFYSDRSINNACAELSDESWEALLEWTYKQGGYVDLKRQDAIAAITAMTSKPVATPLTKTTAPSKFLRYLYREIASSAFHKNYPYLSKEESDLVDLQAKHPKLFKRLKQLVLMTITATHLSQSWRMTNNPDIPDCLKPVIAYYKNDKALLPIILWAIHYAKKSSSLETDIHKRCRWLSLMLPLSEQDLLKKGKQPITLLAAIFWVAFQQISTADQLQINQDNVFATANTFYENMGLDDEDTLSTWLSDNNMTDEINEFLISYTYLEMIYLLENHDFLTPKADINLTHWIYSFPFK